ncbi:MAG: peptidoglycan bridge formation glycyltransferase FemA/FemB family protein [Candidatus Terrybacteria bacterium]|nr:peptidoglycan bridge formation glycyltransferase FemA/FemB family protein [Candidatus Terrybacteria bacterium]
MSEPFGQEAWNAAMLERCASFLQSFEWGEFQERYGRHVSRIAAGGLSGQVIEYALPLGLRYLYVPRGPVGEWNKEAFKRWHEAAKRVARKRGAAFLRIDPPFPIPNSQLHILGLRDTGRSFQPRRNLVLDLPPSLDALLSAMHEKTRYNIRLAERHHVESRIWNLESGGVEAFLALLRSTARKQGIRLHPERYYRTMLDTIPDLPIPNLPRTSPRFAGMVRGSQSSIPTSRLTRRLYLASYQGKPLAAALVLYFGKRATYLHGGTSSEHKNTMAPYALHWRIIRDAREAGCAEYDFGGVDEKQWEGITRFKRGFGGRVEEYAHAHDFIFDSIRYGLYRFGKTILR